MALQSLPKELFDNVIKYTLPEGFEALAVTCRSIYELCTPFIEHHNKLWRHYKRFRHYEVRSDRPDVKFGYVEAPDEIPTGSSRSAFDLIKRIAHEPVIARYIEQATFIRDSWPHRVRNPQFVPDINGGGPLIELFAMSSYLKEAGLDWREYYTAIATHYGRTSSYSQHAAEFVLTLLPNVRILALPWLWKPVDGTPKLLDVIVRRARQSQHGFGGASLAQAIRLSVDSSPSANWGLSNCFLALPRLRAYETRRNEEVVDGPIRLSLNFLSPGLGENLQTVHFDNSYIDEVRISEFLEYTPRLQTFRYWHSATNVHNFTDWDMCRFITAIERKVGHHLVELSVSCDPGDLFSPDFTPGMVSLRGFRCLRRFELPLKIVQWGMDFLKRRRDTQTDCNELESTGACLSELLSDSVTQMGLNAHGMDGDEKLVEVVFRYFTLKRGSQMGALEEMFLSCPEQADQAYKDSCARLAIEAKEVGVALILSESSTSVIPTWEGTLPSIPFRGRFRNHQLR